MATTLYGGIMVVTGFDGKEYEVEPNANLSGTDLAVEGSSLS